MPVPILLRASLALGRRTGGSPITELGSIFSGAPISLNFKMNVKEAEKYLTRLERKAIPSATVKTLNKLAKQGQVQASKSIREHLALNAAFVKKSIWIRKANRNRRIALIGARRNEVIWLKRYKHSVKQLKSKGRFGAQLTSVSVKTLKSKRKRTVKGAFIGPGGHIFKRTGKARLPIRKLAGPSIESRFNHEDTTKAVTSLINRQWPRIFDYEANRAIARLK